MKKSIWMLLTLSLLLTACTGDTDHKSDTEPQHTVPATAEHTEATYISDDTDSAHSGQYALNDLEGLWILESVGIEGELLPAETEGILSTLVFYDNAEDVLCADYSYRDSRREDGERVMLELPVYQFSPESEADHFSAWLDCSAYPYVFAETQGEEYNLRFDDQGNLQLQFVSYTTGDYGIYSVNYMYVRP
ncbi:MAG: hypothetical protein IKU68_02170 [Oscillospiraceae bacterium]|nr:hypothetical protein [Oscillospiraceae bacterium]